MSPVDLLIAPLRILLTALGTGVLPGGDPVTEIISTAADFETIRDVSQMATTAVTNTWQGSGASAAVDAVRRSGVASVDIADDGVQIVEITETAARRVHHAARQLEDLLDSFERTAVALGNDAFTPAGLAALLPVAIDHLARAAAVVERTRGELTSDTAAMAGLARHETPAPITSGAIDPASLGTGEEVAITLPDGSVAYAPNERAATAVRAALSQQGVPYVWGGTDPSGFDCSGFTQWSYRQAGVELPRLAQDQDTAGIAVAQSNLRPGDLAVWSGHVAMYIGNGQMVEAGDPVGVSPVRTTNLDQNFEGFFRPRT